MPRDARCYDVLIASPSDVQVERKIIAECIEDWNAQHSRTTGVIIQPRRWEFDAMPETGDRPQAFINRQIVDMSDMLLGVFWTRLGSPSGVASSGTVEEIDRLVAAGKLAALYFSTMPLPYDHDPAQLAALQEYKKQIQPTALYFDFSTHEHFRRLVSLHLGQRMHDLAGTPSDPPPTSKIARAVLSIRRGTQQRSGDVRTMQVIVELQNLSQSRIREYSCDVSMPKAALTFASAHYVGEIASKDPSRRMMRFTEEGWKGEPIFAGDTRQIVSLELGIEQLKMTGTYLHGDYEGTLADKISADAVIDGEVFHAEMPLSEIFGDLPISD